MEHSRLIDLWSVLDVVLLFSTIIAGAALCWLGRTVTPRMMVLSIYGLYQLLMGCALFVVALQPVPNYHYFTWYWLTSIGENVLLSLLAMEITCALLPRKQSAAAWCAALAVLMVLSIGASMPARAEAKLMNATMAGNFVSGLTLIVLLYFPSVKIPRSLKFVISGILATAGVHAVGTFHWMHGELASFTAAALPISSLAGLALMLAGCVAGRGWFTWQVSTDASNRHCHFGRRNRGTLARIYCLYYR